MREFSMLQDVQCVLLIHLFSILQAIKNSYLQSLNSKNARVRRQTSHVRLYSKGLSTYVRITSTIVDANQSNIEKDPNSKFSR